jgi:hypothetical protein
MAWKKLFRLNNFIKYKIGITNNLAKIMCYSHRTLSGTLLTETQRPDWNTLLESVNVSLTGTVKMVLLNLWIYFRKTQKSRIPEFFFLTNFVISRISFNYFGVWNILKRNMRWKLFWLLHFWIPDIAPVNL